MQRFVKMRFVLESGLERVYTTLGEEFDRAIEDYSQRGPESEDVIALEFMAHDEQEDLAASCQVLIRLDKVVFMEHIVYFIGGEGEETDEGQEAAA